MFKPQILLLCMTAIGVEASKFLGDATDFCPNFPKLAQNVVVEFCRPFLCCDLKKMVFTCFSANLGRHFSKSNNVGRHFCPNFQGYCPDFQHIKTFGVRLRPRLLHH